MEIQVASENALMIYADAPDLNQRHGQIDHLRRQILKHNPEWLLDLVPAYDSLLVRFDWQQVDHLHVKQFIRKQLGTGRVEQPAEQNVVVLPVLYGYPANNDLARIAQHNSITQDDVIRLHQAQTYRVYAIGFAPGFAFLGEVPLALATPRLDTPRQRVPAGAVAIAERQTAVYPSISPGGWNILGLCPKTLFSPMNEPAMPFAIGDTVRFEAIDHDEFVRLGGRLES